MRKTTNSTLKLKAFYLSSALFLIISYFVTIFVISSEYYSTVANSENAIKLYAENELQNFVSNNQELLKNNSFAPLNTGGTLDTYLITINNEPILEYHNKNISTNRSDLKLIFANASLQKGENNYQLYISLDFSNYREKITFKIYYSLAIIIIISLIFGFLFSIFTSVITMNLNEIAQYLKQLSNNSYPAKLNIGTTEEIIELSQSVNILSNEIQVNLNNYKDSIDSFIHEIKTPLTSIVGYAELLEKSQNFTADESEKVSYILTESKRLSSLTHKLIYFQAMDKKKITFKKILLENLLEDILLSTRARARLKNITISMPESSEIYLYGDRELLTTLLVNVLDNAIKASNYSSRIIISITSISKALSALSIQDFGSGIPKNELNKIFQPFYMLKGNMGNYKTGLGLGLSICQTIATAHHAQILLESNLGEGTSVNIIFPFSEYKDKLLAENTNSDEDILYTFPILP